MAVTGKSGKAYKPVEEELSGTSSFADVVGSMPNPDVIMRKAGIAIDVYEEMMYDPQIYAAFQKRRRIALKSQYTIEGEDAAATELCGDIIDSLGMNNILVGMLKAIPYGYSVSELIWSVRDDGKWVVSEVKNRHPKLFSFSASGELVFQDKDGMEAIAPYGKFIVHRNEHDDDGNPYGNALNSRCYWYWRFKKHGWRVWGLYLEKYGDPPLKMKTQETDEDKLKELLAHLDSVSNGSNIVVGTEEDVAPIQVPSSTSIGYGEYAGEADRQISKVYLGSSIAIDDAKYGTYAATKEHVELLKDLSLTDLKEVGASIRKYLFEPIVKFNFGDGVPIPEITFSFPAEMETDEQADNGAQIEGEGANTEEHVVDGDSDHFGLAERDHFQLPLHKRTVETLSANLLKKQAKYIRKFFSLDKMPPSPSHGAAALSRKYHQLVDDISDSIGYALFFLSMYAKFATPTYRTKMSADAFSSPEIESAPILPYDDARRLFEKKVPISDDEFRRLVGDARRGAFSMAHITSLSLLSRIQRSLAKSYQDGAGEYEWRSIGKDLIESVLGRGTVTDHHLANVYRTNLFSAYAQASYNQWKIVKEQFPALMYDAVGDERTRPAHLALDGLVFMADDKFWDTHYPPNGYNCRCSVIPISKSRLKKIKVEDGKNYTGPEYAPDPGWSFHGGKGIPEFTYRELARSRRWMPNYTFYGLDDRLAPESIDKLIDPEKIIDEFDGEDVRTPFGTRVFFKPKNPLPDKNLLFDVLKNPDEVWQDFDYQNGRVLTAVKFIKAVEGNGKKAVYVVVVDDRGQYSSMRYGDNRDRSGVLLYPSVDIDPKSYPDEIANAVDRFVGDPEFANNVRQSYYTNKKDAVKRPFDKMFSMYEGNNDRKTLSRGIGFDTNDERERFVESVRSAGMITDDAPSTYRAEEKPKVGGSKYGVEFIVGNVDVEGYFGKSEQLSRDVIIAPSTKMKVVSVDEPKDDSDVYRIYLEVVK